MLYLIYTAVPFKALRLGAEPFELGLLAAVSTGAYALLAVVFGRLSDSGHRTRTARATCVVICAGCLALTLSPSVGWMLLCIPLIGGGMAPFWPGVQSSLADRSSVARLSHNLGVFNLSWSTGKGCGFFLGGFLVASWGATAAWTLATLIAFILFFVLPPDAPRQEQADGETATTPDHEVAITSRSPDSAATPTYDPRAPVFRSLAWIANSIAFGLAATLNHHYPRLIREFGWSENVFGAFLGGIFLVQSLTFLVLRRVPSLWRFQRSRLYGVQILMLVAIVTLPLADLPRVLVSAVVFGVGLGFCYYSSIYYSLHAGSSRGRNAGVHESLLGVGSMLVPFLGGWSAKATGLLAAPYVVAGALVGFALVLQELAFQRGRPRPT
jgi:predicted MFS family arabinose efflux permease